MDNSPSLPFTIPQVENRQYVFEGFYKVREDRLRLNEHTHYDYYTVVGRENAVMIVAETEEGQLIINREYRHPTEEVLLSLPGGALEKGESPLEGGLRELREETGYHSDSLSLLGRAYPLPGMYAQSIYYVLAQNCHKVADPSLEIAEFIHTELYELSALEQAIRSGSAVDGVLCSALFFYKNK